MRGENEQTAEQRKAEAAIDGTLLNLKRIAMRGGERGPLYDQGTLDVISQIEALGYWMPNRMCSLIGALSVQERAAILRPEEVAEAKEFLAEKGWTIDQGIEYASGVDGAERMLFRFKIRDGQ